MEQSARNPRGKFSSDRAAVIGAKRGDPKACGHEAERVAREMILPSIGCDIVDGRSEFACTEHVPFDAVAKYKDEVWLVEVKVAFPPENASVKPEQERRMFKLCRLLQEADVAVVPRLLGVDYWGAGYALLDYPTTSRGSTGEDADLPDLAERVAGWVKRTMASHPT